MKTFMIIMGMFVVIVLIYGISIYNRFVHVKNKVEEALSGIDVALAKRYAVLTNLVEVVKGYVKHEEMVLTTLVQFRNHITMKERVEADENYTAVTERLFALQESYPDLKANEQFLSLQNAIKDVEEHLAASRRMYNANVSVYNDLVMSFPSGMIGRWMHAKKMEYFQANGNERKHVSIQM